MAEPTLGETIRGARLGYGWCGEIWAFVRISPAGPGRFMADIRPPGDVPHRLEADEPHYVWWSQPDQARIGATLARLLGGDTRSVRIRRRLALTLPDSLKLAP